MALITLEEYRTYIQVSDTSRDAGYTAFIESVSADVESMANQYFNLEYAVSTSLDSAVICSDVELYDVFEGASITGVGIPARAILQDVSMYSVNMNKYATITGDITATFNAVPEQIKPVIASMILYKTVNSTSSSGGNVKDIKSKGLGPLSLSFGTGAAIDSDYGYPKNLVKSIKKIKRISYDKGELRTRGMDITNIERC